MNQLLDPPRVVETTLAADQKIEVRKATLEDRSRWDTFVQSQDDRSVFHAWAWHDVLPKIFGNISHSLIAVASNEIVGVLPLFEVKTMLFGHSLVSIPFGHYAGPLAHNRKIEELLIAKSLDLGQKLGVGHVEMRHTRPITNWPKNDLLYVTFKKQISLNAEENLAAIPRKQRAMVRKGIKNELIAELGTTKEFFELYSENMHRHGSPTYSQKYFDCLLSNFPGKADIWIVKNSSGKPLTGVLTLYNDREAFPIYAGDTDSARGLAANDFKYWTLMTHAAAKGCTLFNFGRSKVGTGSYDFKRYWGFEPIPLTYEYKLIKRDSIPANNPANPKFQLLVKTWRLLPRSLVNRLGPIIVKGLG